MKSMPNNIAVDELDDPNTVRTPGRTWTEIEFDAAELGSGTLTVKAPDPVEVLSLEMAQEQYPDKVDQILFSQVGPNENQITGAHAKLVEETVFIHVPDGTVVDEEITVTSTAADGFYPHHVLVYVEDGASAAVVETNTGDGDTDSSFSEMYVGEQASLRYTKINDLDTRLGYSENAATVEDGSTFNALVLSVGSDTYKNRMHTRLTGPEADLQYNLGFITATEQHMDITTHVVHDADHTRCDMESRGVALDRSRAVYKGVQEVEEHAERTKSFQNEQTIMVGDDCEADTTPQLQIDNNDVEATHAATTGHIDEEDLFYLTSRGVREHAAKREIITGMFDDLIKDSNDAGSDIIHRKIQDTLR